ncbi:hypothetical protein N7508_007061 [Penicillium antarcticum]|uniref:uncharacterized protein n=1 Tax=Penicillium antarcticum TaxID=416450 RepID=UPI00238793AA|nr:uncharacterized protein N7508_007061 [Penicillium antarcticum]KAJ5302198.1 hypothetical protein N7508_007061 [Penicillium antarcticum]
MSLVRSVSEITGNDGILTHEADELLQFYEFNCTENEEPEQEPNIQQSENIKSANEKEFTSPLNEVMKNLNDIPKSIVESWDL